MSWIGRLRSTKFGSVSRDMMASAVSAFGKRQDGVGQKRDPGDRDRPGERAGDAAPDHQLRLVAERQPDEQDVEVDEVPEAQAHLDRELHLGERVGNREREGKQRGIEGDLRVGLPPAEETEPLHSMPPVAGDDEEGEQKLVEEHSGNGTSSRGRAPITISETVRPRSASSRPAASSAARLSAIRVSWRLFSRVRKDRSICDGVGSHGEILPPDDSGVSSAG